MSGKNLVKDRTKGKQKMQRKKIKNKSNRLKTSNEMSGTINRRLYEMALNNRRQWCIMLLILPQYHLSICIWTMYSKLRLFYFSLSLPHCASNESTGVQINCSKTMLKSVAMWDQAKRWMGEKRESQDGNRIVTIIKDNYDALKSLWWYLHCKRSYMVRSAQRSAELYVVIFIDFCAYFHWDFKINNRANRKPTIRSWKKV